MPEVRSVRPLAVEAIVACEDCDGAGKVYDPDGFYERTSGMSGEQFSRYAAERCGRDGYGMLRLPPEEAPCSECGGTGERRKRLTLDELRGALRDA